MVGRGACGGFDVRGVVERNCAPARALEKRWITALRLTSGNDAVKVGGVLRPLDLDEGSRCHFLRL